MLSGLVLVLCAGVTPALQHLLDARLAGGPPVAPAMQRELADSLRWTAASPRGVRVGGDAPAVRDLDPAPLAVEIGPDVPVLHYVAVHGRGPGALRVHAPVPPDAGEIEVFRHVEPGLFVRIDDPVNARGDMASFPVRFPGRFVVRPRDGRSEEHGKGAVYQKPPPDRDPARKGHWRLYRELVDECVGPHPLVLVHGLGTDRWDEFRRWAAHSPEAEAFRAHYQVWNFFHELGGINTSVGFDPDCPAFEESIVAHLHRFMVAAEAEGVETDGIRHFFPDGPVAYMANSQGTLKIRAFLVNFPEYGARVSAIISLGGANTGSPWATPEWLRHTASRLGFLKPNLLELLVAAGFSTNYFSTSAQTDLDSAWQNHDAAGGWGIPTRHFTTWTPEGGRERRVLSPRDALRDDARSQPGYEEDQSFEPPQLLDTYCGTPDRVTPSERGGLHTDRIFLYASYIRRGRDWLDTLAQATRGAQSPPLSLFENAGLRLTHTLFGLVASEGGDWPLGVYRFGDGFVPIQSQLLLDGRETALPYRTTRLFGWEVPDFPLRPNWDVIHAHTLGDPAKIRLFPGWSHLDTVTGRYNRRTGESPLYRKVAEDLVSVLPQAG